VTVRLELGGLSFEWDLEKARINKLKHGVDFDEAASTFLDPQLTGGLGRHALGLGGTMDPDRHVEARSHADDVVHSSGPVAQDHRLQDRECAGTS